MKTKLKQEYRQKTKEEIISALEKKRRELVETRFKMNQGKIKDTRAAVKLGDEIAVLENILRENPEPEQVRFRAGVQKESKTVSNIQKKIIKKKKIIRKKETKKEEKK